MRHTKIIATVGPASSTPQALEQLIAAGADVLRLNFSHGSRESHAAAVVAIRAAARRVGRHVAILQDLSGPKIRTGTLRNHEPLSLSPGGALEIRAGDQPGEPGLVFTTYAPLIEAVRVGDDLLLDDGKITLRVESRTPQGILTRVIDGGPLAEHKGINAPAVPLPGGVTAKDVDDLRFGIAAGVDLVALSFVQSGDDVGRARAIAAEAGRGTVPFIAKLERPEAIRHLPEITAASDALMVARGDLALEMPLEEVPQVQKQVLRLARDRGIPVIVATQVLESMRTEPRPTRAEVSDAAGAVDAGADAIMLSGETAVGAFPVRSVEVLDRIIRSAEALPPVWTLLPPAHERPDHLPPLCDAVVTLASRAGVDAIFAITRKGRTARLLAARRPAAPIFAITAGEHIASALCLWWGVEPVLDSLEGDLDAIVGRVVARLRAAGRLAASTVAVTVSGSPDLARPDANFVRARRL